MAAGVVDPHRLVAALQSGQDDEAGVARYLAAGYRPQELLGATLGRPGSRSGSGSGSGGCARSLRLLLAAKADPNEVDARGGPSVLHVAAWTSSPEVISVLLDHGADLERKEPGTEVPALNAALAAGNAPAALKLLERGADAAWRHKDGATALHVALSWLTDASPDALSRRRRPSLRGGGSTEEEGACGGDAEPVRLVRTLIRAGADPSLPMTGNAKDGVTALGAFRTAMPGSPWVREAGMSEDFARVAEEISAILEASEKATRLKNEGNAAFTKGSLEKALGLFLEAQASLKSQRLEGQALAVLLSNEALCHKKLGDLERCRLCCEAGLKQPCTEKVRAKLEFNKEAAIAALAAAEAVLPTTPCDKNTLVVPSTGAAAPATASTTANPIAKPLLDKQTPAPSPPALFPAASTSTLKSKLKAGFLTGSGGELYGPKGSEQGKNHSDLVKVPVFGTRQEVPFGKVRPIVMEKEEKMQGDEKESDEDS